MDMPQKLPTKLEKEPLIDAVFELRFSSDVAASNVLPGFLFSKLKGNKNIKRLPAAELPKPVRDTNSNLQFTPLVQLHWDNWIISISDSSLLVGCTLPYPGWKDFKPAILQIINIVNEVDIIKSVQRYSMKYIDLITLKDLHEQVASVRASIVLGNHTLEKEHFSLRIEIPKEKHLHAVNIISSAVATLQDGSKKAGIIVDIDTITNADNQPFNTWIEQLSENLESMHTANKEMFFECLQPKTIESLGPVYE